jgi:glutamate carboxypeptidase
LNELNEHPDCEFLISGISRWVEIETPTRHASPINRLIDMIVAEAESFGAVIQRYPGGEFGDAVAISSPWGRPGTGVLMLGHLDTVHPLGTMSTRLPLRREGDRFYGPGTLDMKGGVYLAFDALRWVVQSGGAPLPITLLLVPDEEIGSPFSRPITERMARSATYVLDFEAGRDNDGVVTARKGYAEYELIAVGRPAHPGDDHAKGRSAIREIAQQIVRLEGLTDYTTGLTANVGVVKGGDYVNVVPERCSALVEFRMPNNELAEKVRTMMTNLQSFDPDVGVSAKLRLEQPPYAVSSAGRALFEKASAVASEIGIELRAVSAAGSSDANLAAGAGAAVLDGLGPEGAGDHTLDEHIRISSIVPRARLVRALLANLS